jgi:histidyl-tRNA synthetase
VAGPDERAAGEATLKIMATGAQQKVKLADLPNAVQAALAP